MQNDLDQTPPEPIDPLEARGAIKSIALSQECYLIRIPMDKNPDKLEASLVQILGRRNVFRSGENIAILEAAINQAKENDPNKLDRLYDVLDIMNREQVRHSRPTAPVANHIVAAVKMKEEPENPVSEQYKPEQVMQELEKSLGKFTGKIFESRPAGRITVFIAPGDITEEQRSSLRDIGIKDQFASGRIAFQVNTSNLGAVVELNAKLEKLLEGQTPKR